MYRKDFPLSIADFPKVSFFTFRYTKSVYLDRESMTHVADKYNAEHGVAYNDWVTNPKVDLESRTHQSVRQWF